MSTNDRIQTIRSFFLLNILGGKFMKNKPNHTLWKMYRYYDKRRKVSKTILNILSIFIFIGFFLALGTTGSIELDEIPLKQGIIQYLISIALIGIPAHHSNHIALINETATYRLKKIKSILDERTQNQINEKELTYGYTTSR